jgi:hypothetical protein
MHPTKGWFMFSVRRKHMVISWFPMKAVRMDGWLAGCPLFFIPSGQTVNGSGWPTAGGHPASG